MPLTRTLSLTFLASISLFVTPRWAAADDKQECAGASERAQVKKDEHKLIEARELFRTCARAACPGVIRKDCVDAVADLDHRIPSLVVRAKGDEGVDLVDVKVELDGREVKLEGRAIELEPGVHKLRVTSAQRVDIEQRVVVAEGDRQRLIEVTLVRRDRPKPPQPAPEAQPKSEGGGIPTAAWILGGVGVASLGGFGYFALTGSSDVRSMRNECAPNCPDDRVSDAKTKLLLGDIFLGAGIVSLGIATVLVLTNKEESPARVNVTVLPSGGAVGSAAVRF